MKNFYDYMIARYGNQTATPNLYEMIQELEERMLKLEEENVETTNTLYEIMHDIDAVDARIDILHTHNDE